MTHPGKEKLQAILDGLEGVTPGPYRQGVEGNIRLYGPDGRGSFSGAIATYLRRSDVSHIARCDPDTMREIGEYVESLEAENARLREALELIEDFGDDGMHQIARAALKDE